MNTASLNRRDFIKCASLGTVGLTGLLSERSVLGAEKVPLVASIEKVVVRRGRDGSGPTWFHPRACTMPGPTGTTVFMTLQPVLGSDNFGPVHWMESRDRGVSWTDPQLVPGLGRIAQPDGNKEGVCDVVPEYHAASGTVLALGHNVFYRDNRFIREQPPRWPVYSVWRDGRWGPRRRLEWADPRGPYIWRRWIP